MTATSIPRKSQRARAGVTIRLDRLVISGAARKGACVKQIEGFKVESDFRLQGSGKIFTFERVRKFKGRRKSTLINQQYKPQKPWLAPCRFTLIGDDQTGITPAEIMALSRDITGPKVTMFELAFDFPAALKIDRAFILRHGSFGKSHRRKEPPNRLRYGSRSSAKFVRCYFKEQITSFRVELEIHSALIRKYGAFNLQDLSSCALRLYPAHICFVELSWRRLRRHLTYKFGTRAGLVFAETKKRASISLRRATRYLSQQGVSNVHRFLRPLRMNDELQQALRSWAERFSVWEELFVD
jgi:hypothetical protein